MALVDINWKPSKKDLRIFALLLMLFGGIISLVVRVKYSDPIASLWVLAISTGLGAAGLLVPKLIRPVYVIWMALAFPIGWSVSHLMMAIVFYLVVTPIGLMMRLCGRDPMERRFDRSAKSYWVRRTPSRDVKRYFRQF